MSHFYIGRNKIHYFDNKKNRAISLVFIHGNSHSMGTFCHQLRSEVFDDFRLIALDLPGHGKSGKRESYSIDVLVSALADLVSDLGLEQFVFVGHSLGGHVALHSLTRLSPLGVFVFGTPPLKFPVNFEAFKAHPKLEFLFKNKVSLSDAKSLLAAMYSSSFDLNQSDVEDFFKTDGIFRESFSQSVAEGKTLDECLILNEYHGKCWVIASDEDNLINASYIQKVLPEELVHLNKWCHNYHREFPDKFNLTLRKFLDNLVAKVDCYEQRKSSENFTGLASGALDDRINSERTGHHHGNFSV